MMRVVTPTLIACKENENKQKIVKYKRACKILCCFVSTLKWKSTVLCKLSCLLWENVKRTAAFLVKEPLGVRILSKLVSTAWVREPVIPVSYQKRLYKSLMTMKTFKRQVKLLKVCSFGWNEVLPKREHFIYYLYLHIYIYIYTHTHIYIYVWKEHSEDKKTLGHF